MPHGSRLKHTAIGARPRLFQAKSGIAVIAFAPSRISTTITPPSLAGIGEKKRAEFGEIVTTEIADYLTANSRMAFE
jgi:hypothetical protein